MLVFQELESYVVVSRLTQVLGTGLGPSGRAANALSHQPISPGPPTPVDL